MKSLSQALGVIVTIVFMFFLFKMTVRWFGIEPEVNRIGNVIKKTVKEGMKDLADSIEKSNEPDNLENENNIQKAPDEKEPVNEQNEDKPKDRNDGFEYYKANSQLAMEYLGEFDPCACPYSQRRNPALSKYPVACHGVGTITLLLCSHKLMLC